MKGLITSISILFYLIIAVSCNNQESYYEQFSNDKLFSDRILDLNQTIDQIRKTEKGKLVQENIQLLKYVYEIGETGTYIIAYLFDEQGCYEIGVDGYFEKEEDAKNVADGIKKEMNQSAYNAATEDNNLNRWKNKSESITIELDSKGVSRGLLLITIFANE